MPKKSLAFLAAALLMTGCAFRLFQSRALPEVCDPGADQAVAQEDWEKALAGHERLLAQQPDNCLATYHLGFIWGRLGNREREIDFYKAALACGRVFDDQLYFNLGMAYGDTGDLDRALQAFTQGAAINPGNPDLCFGLGLIHLAADRPLQAEAALRQALQADPLHLEAHLTLARFYLDQGRWEEAEQHLDQVQQIDPEAQEARELRSILRERQALEYKR